MMTIQNGGQKVKKKNKNFKDFSIGKKRKMKFQIGFLMRCKIRETRVDKKRVDIFLNFIMQITKQMLNCTKR